MLISAVQELAHLTWAGRVTWVYYALRRLFVRPAPSEDRCFMGAPIGGLIHCPRRAEGDDIWCRQHGGRAGLGHD